MKTSRKHRHDDSEQNEQKTAEHNEQEKKESEHKKTTHEAHHEAHEHKTTKKRKTSLEEELKPSRLKLPGATYPVISSIIIVVILTLVIILLLRKPFSETNTTYTGNKVKVEFYVMSQCPYGTQVENAIAPVLENMGDAIDFHLDYIVTETAPGVFQSLHGAKEVTGNIVQLCAAKYYPKDYQYMKMIVCQNNDAANVDTNWEACARQNGMDVEKLRSCLNSEEGKTLLRESMQKAQARNARGSPTMYFNNEQYNGARDSLSFQRAVCKSVEHPACKALPLCASDADCTAQEGKEGTCVNPGKADAYCTYSDPVPVKLVVLTSADCKSSTCDTTRLVSIFKQLFMGIDIKNVDIASEEGKALVQKYNIEVVPAFILDSNLEKTKTWRSQPDLSTAFEKLSDGSYKLLDEITGANYFVSEKARQEFYDAIGVKLGDNKPQIDFFVMSYCPYGNQAEEAIEPVYQLLKDKAIFNPRYVIYSNYGGGGPNYCIDNGNLCSMHGIQELNQDIREACVNKYLGIGKWFEFALAMNKECNSGNADSCWEGVAKKLGLDFEMIKKCQAEEGVALMRENKALGDKLRVSGSPTVFIDGESYAGARTPEAYKTALCGAFETQPSECSVTLSGASTTTPTTGGCG